MAQKLMYLFTIIFVALFAVSCGESDYFEQAAKAPVTPQERTIRYHYPVDSIHVNFVDSVGQPVISNYEYHGYASLVAQDTLRIDAKEPWLTAEALQRAPKVMDELTFKYNHGNNIVKNSVKVVYNGREIPLWKPENLSVTCNSTVTVEETRNNLYYGETESLYNLCYGNILLASATQVFVAEEGYKPSFERMEWKSWHFGPATASYANGLATVTCPDSLVAHEVWDDGSNRNWLRTTTTSKNIFSVTVGNTELNSLSAVVGKTLTVNGDKASVADFTITVTRTSKSIVEKTKSYTYNGKTINFIDSLTACGYKLKGGQVLSKTQVRIDLVREGATETVSFEVPVTLTEKVTLKEILREYIHKAFRKNANASGNNIAVICDNDATFVKVWSNNTKDNPVVEGYTWTNNFRYNIPSGLTVDVIGHTYNFINGSTTVEGKNVTVTFSSRSISDIMFEGQNYKNEAPQCSATVKSITFNSKTQATVTFEGEGKTITALVPVNLIETEVITGKIIAGWATDSYETTSNFHYSWHACTFQILVLNNGIYTVYSRDVNSTSGWRKTEIASSLATNGKPLAYVGTNGEAAIGYINVVADQGSWCKIVYCNADGSNDKVLSDTEHTFHSNSNDDLFMRNPVRATWNNGKLEADGHVLYVTGSQN